MEGLFSVEDVFIALEDAGSPALEEEESDFEGEEIFCYSLGGVTEVGDFPEEEDTILEEEEEEDAILEEDNDEWSDQPVPTESRDELGGEY